MIHIDAITQMREEYQDAIVHQARIQQVCDESMINNVCEDAICRWKNRTMSYRARHWYGVAFSYPRVIIQMPHPITTAGRLLRISNVRFVATYVRDDLKCASHIKKDRSINSHTLLENLRHRVPKCCLTE